MIRCLFILILLAPLQERPDYPLKNGDHDSLELGFYYPNEIFITNAEVFLAYEVGELSKKERDSINHSNRENPGSRFIEEGICEYVTLKMNELIPPKRLFIPKTPSDLTRQENRYKIFLKYSSHCLSGFLDTTGLKQGMKILLHNRPPSTDEILKPDLFFKRLEGIPQM